MFVSYLASVAVGYGWISDTKFQKFLDKDWIRMCQNFFGYGSGVEKSISVHLWCACTEQANILESRSWVSNMQLARAFCAARDAVGEF